MSGNEFFIVLTAVCYFLFFSLFIYVDNFSLTFFSTKNIKLLTPFAFLSCRLCEKFYFSTFDQELMNARERSIFFNNNKKENTSKYKDKKWINTFLSSQKAKDIIINELVNNKKEDKIISPNKNNKEYIDKLFRDIIYLNEKEKIIEKNIKINK